MLTCPYKNLYLFSTILTNSKTNGKTMKKLSLVFIIFFLGLSTNLLMSQGNSDKIKGSSSLMLQVFGPELLGVHYNYYVTYRISINAGIGLNMDVHLGSNFYLKNRSKSSSSLFLGAQIIAYREYHLLGNFFGGPDTQHDTQIGLYIPFGYEYLGKKGFTLQVDIGPNFVKEDWGQTNTIPFFGSLKIGYTFKKRS